MDSVARKLRIGGLEGRDGSYVATSDLSPKDRNRVEKLAAMRQPLSNPSSALRGVAEAIIGRKKGDVQKEINSIYSSSRRNSMPPIGDVVASGNRAQAMNTAEVNRMGVGPKPTKSAKPGKVLSSSGTGYGSFKNKK